MSILVSDQVQREPRFVSKYTALLRGGEMNWNLEPCAKV